MNADLIETIQEIGKSNFWEIVSVIIGIIGTLFSAIVLFYNHKAIELTRKTMQQTVDLQLYEKRMGFYSALSNDNAFAKAPLELSIIFSNKVYNLYVEMVGLCENQVQLFFDAYKFIDFGSDKGFGNRNVSSDIYERVIYTISGTVGMLEQYHHESDSIEELIKLKETLETVHQDIVSKYEILECEMRRIIEKSIF